MSTDQGKVEAFMGKMLGHMTGVTVCYSVWLGDELGLYRAMAGAGPVTSEAIAKKTKCNPRLIREWLDGQAASGLVEYEPKNDSYNLSAEAAMALADDTSPVLVARAMNAFASMFFDMEMVAKAFRGDGSLSWGEHHTCLFSGTEWFFRTGYRANLTTQWIPALDGVKERLEAAHASPMLVWARRVCRRDGERVPEIEVLRLRFSRALHRDLEEARG